MPIVILIIVIVLVVLVAAGAVDGSTAPPVTAPADNCYSCRKLESWWRNLPWYRQLYSWLWYLVNHLACLAKGCRE